MLVMVLSCLVLIVFIIFEHMGWCLWSCWGVQISVECLCFLSVRDGLLQHLFPYNGRAMPRSWMKHLISDKSSEFSFLSQVPLRWFFYRADASDRMVWFHSRLSYVRSSCWERLVDISLRQGGCKILFVSAMWRTLGLLRSFFLHLFFLLSILSVPFFLLRTGSIHKRYHGIRKKKPPEKEKMIIKM